MGRPKIAAASVSAAPDLRSRHVPPHAFSEDYISEIDEFIESFNPTESPYNLEHAPNRRYLATGLTFTLMFKLLKEH